ncbi:hypothetical protein B0J14DRAFT_312664 [Halenospora varia]|nr:hypothetical protein B0J14DRAFT_312664 [Halenospora varia]
MNLNWIWIPLLCFRFLSGKSFETLARIDASSRTSHKASTSPHFVPRHTNTTSLPRRPFSPSVPGLCALSASIRVKSFFYVLLHIDRGRGPLVSAAQSLMSRSCSLFRCRPFP